MFPKDGPAGNDPSTQPVLDDMGDTNQQFDTLIKATSTELYRYAIGLCHNPTVAEDLANCPDRRRIFLTSAGVLPPLVAFEKAKRVVAAFKEL